MGATDLHVPAYIDRLTPLLTTPQWIIVLLAPLDNGKMEKLPIDYRTAQVTPKGSDGAHNPAIWTTYDHARNCAQMWGPQFTVGFVLTENDPFFCLDIDNALQPDGTWSPLSQQLCASLPNTVIEVSQSGRGLHVWGQGVVPPHGMKRVDLAIEFYTEKRFIAIGHSQVGDMTQPCPTVAAFVQQYFPPRERVATVGDGPAPEWRGPEDDDDLIRRALQSKSARSTFGGGASFADLWECNVEVLARAYKPDQSSSEPFDRSSADAALAQHLAFWTGRDAGRIDRLMRQSGLKREKYDRDDYMARTIDNACSMQREVYREREALPATAAGAWQPQDPEAIHQARDFSISDPLSATKLFVRERHQHAEGSLLRTWHGAFYRWGAAHWREITEADVKSQLYDFMDRQPGSDYRPDQTRINKVLDALRHAPTVHLDSALMPPCWISGASPAPAADLVACANGLLHLPSRSLFPSSPRFFNLNAVPFDYNPHAPPPAEWLGFLATIWPSDPEAIATLQELFGYLLTPDTSQQKIFLMVGPKRSGKGTIARVLAGMLGPANVAGPTLDSLSKDFGLQPLIGALAAIVSDARISKRADQAQIAEHLLRISGEDRVTVNRKYLPPITMQLATRFLLLSNELPRIADASGAMASRFVIFTMNQSFLGREDPGLTSRLLRELPGVLVWAVEGWHRLRTQGYFKPPASSAAASQELADLGSPIAAFVRDRCVLSPHFEVATDALFVEWCDWCVRNHSHPGDKITFGRDLGSAFPQIEKGQRRAGRVYRGIAPSPHVTGDGLLSVPLPPHFR